MKVYYLNDHIEIHVPIYIGNMKPLFEVYTYYKYEDIPKKIINGLNQDQSDSIMWFFFDQEDRITDDWYNIMRIFL